MVIMRLVGGGVTYDVTVVFRTTPVEKKKRSEEEKVHRIFLKYGLETNFDRSRVPNAKWPVRKKKSAYAKPLF